MYKLEYPIFDINDLTNNFEEIVPHLPDTCWVAAVTADCELFGGSDGDYMVTWIIETEDPNLDITTLPYPFGVGDVNKWTKV
jgi:hypothetical protein